MNKVQRPSAVFFSDERPSRKSLLSSASCITGGNQLLWTMSALMLSACGGGDKVVSAGWRDTGTDKVVDGITYDVFKDNSDATLAELWVDQDVSVAGITADII